MHIETATVQRGDLANAVSTARLIAGSAGVLAVLSRGPATAVRIADEAGFLASNVPSKLARLHAAGVVDFVTVPSGGRYGRKYIYSITPYGAELWRATRHLASNAPRRSS
ncbi:MarR family winged helix-turn-helix transcriptional regulator [Paludisphaera rhizosphaerae]|uniref:MarR family winged helix-turn-helix transcriptional regulator n=1 Tax=Paludisphaera rhizosphaerae TaxID=2711216 RepID=UPI0013E9F013|nr:MarR family winged helix-turn-helix transcriptional regulator [Paludisphaera rhizosphaerae]